MNLADLRSITKTIRDPLFWAFTYMSLQVKELTKRMMSWAESCLCHSKTCHDKTEDQRRRILGRELDFDIHDVEVRQLRICNCPMEGMRAPELALGFHELHLRNLSMAAEADIMSSACVDLRERSRTIIMQNF